MTEESLDLRIRPKGEQIVFANDRIHGYLIGIFVQNTLRAAGGHR